MKLKYILENKILIPRRSKEERSKNLAAVHYKQIQEYIKNGSEGSLDLTGTPLKILPPELVNVGGNFDLGDSKIENLNNLEFVGGYFNLYDTQLESLGNLKYVGGELNVLDSKVKSLGNLKYVGGDIMLIGNPIVNPQIEQQIRQHIEVKGKIYFVDDGYGDY